MKPEAKIHGLRKTETIEFSPDDSQEDATEKFRLMQSWITAARQHDPIAAMKRHLENLGLPAQPGRSVVIEPDGKWRKLDVDYVGKGSYKVRARTGYYAVRGTHRPLDAAPISLPADQDPAVTGQADPAAAESSEDDAAPAGAPSAE